MLCEIDIVNKNGQKLMWTMSILSTEYRPCQWTNWNHFDKYQWRWWWWWRGLDLTRPHYYMGSPKIIYINWTGIRIYVDSRIDNLSIYQGWDHDIFKWTHTYSQITHRWMVWWRNYFNLFQGILYFFFYLSYLRLQILWL